MTRIEGVASRLLLLVALRSEMDQVLKAAEELSTIEKRLVLLLLAIWIVQERDASAAERIARMMPANHARVKWALAGAKGKLGNTAPIRIFCMASRALLQTIISDCVSR